MCSADVDITSCHYGAHCVNMSNNFTYLCKNGFVGRGLQCDGKSPAKARLDLEYIMAEGSTFDKSHGNKS